MKSTMFLSTFFVLCSACSTTYVARDPTNETFPLVRGTSLAGEELELPTAVRGAPVLLIVGYKQNAQFDIDRWLLGLHQSNTEVKVYEVPTIPGLIPGMIAGTIDDGMRSGIPQEDWASVITVYDDADEIAAFTGNENGITGRVILLDSDGRVAFFHDRGYSVASLEELRAALELVETATASL